MALGCYSIRFEERSARPNSNMVYCAVLHSVATLGPSNDCKLAAEGANIDAGCTMWKSTNAIPLMQACDAGQAAVVRLLVNSCSDPSQQSRSRASLLRSASRFSRIGVAKEELPFARSLAMGR